MARAVSIFMPCSISLVGLAKIYNVVNEHRRVVFTDKPSVEAEVIEVKVNSIQGLTTATYFKSTSNTGGPVVMYPTAWCGVCKKAG